MSRISKVVRPASRSGSIANASSLNVQLESLCIFERKVGKRYSRVTVDCLQNIFDVHLGNNLAGSLLIPSSHQVSSVQYLPAIILSLFQGWL